MSAYSKITDDGYASRKEIATVWELCFMRIKFRIRANKWELFDAVREKNHGQRQLWEERNLFVLQFLVAVHQHMKKREVGA